MNNIDRGMLKWAPFNSVVSNKEIIYAIQKEKSKIKMPCLSDDQKLNIENKLIEAFYENKKIAIKYFLAGKIFYKTGSIKKIDPIFHKIYFDNLILIFEQIIDVN